MKNNARISFALLSLTLLAAACGGGQPKDKSAQLAALKDQKAALEAQIAQLENEAGGTPGVSKHIRTVGLTELQPQLFRHFIDLQGKVDAEDNVPVTAKMAGQITRVLIKNGDAVKKGQLLAALDDELMLKGLSELELQLRTAEDIYNRQKGLWDQKIGTEVQFIQARTNKEALEQRIATTKEQWQYTKIYAPISGTVDMVILKAGQAIAPGSPLCHIINMGQLKITGQVPEAYAAKVRQGYAVQLFFPDLNKEVASRVSYVSKSINPTNRTFTVECALPAGADYRANMIAVMKIIDYQNPRAIVVPVNLIQTAEDGDFVLVADKTGDKQAVVRKANVRQGGTYNGMVEITGGLNPGDLAISTGFQDVNNGETVAF
ncbi:MAG: efflux RND transporter periplasmic adaptor subunit [Saprospirales bacterium]|jgi:membrane fusion protein (multidrug efflux system)|nr:efflux RND transporter periplasmic adaptor subunit [Saprospirales bacterium]MBK8920462.1 efflux RND transporter periplasmic adaptor subunit [Saprospirales bacterium]